MLGFVFGDVGARIALDDEKAAVIAIDAIQKETVVCIQRQRWLADTRRIELDLHENVETSAIKKLMSTDHHGMRRLALIKDQTRRQIVIDSLRLGVEFFLGNVAVAISVERNGLGQLLKRNLEATCKAVFRNVEEHIAFAGAVSMTLTDEGEQQADGAKQQA